MPCSPEMQRHGDTRQLHHSVARPRQHPNQTRLAAMPSRKRSGQRLDAPTLVSRRRPHQLPPALFCPGHSVRPWIQRCCPVDVVDVVSGCCRPSYPGQPASGCGPRLPRSGARGRGRLLRTTHRDPIALPLPSWTLHPELANPLNLNRWIRRRSTIRREQTHAGTPCWFDHAVYYYQH